MVDLLSVINHVYVQTSLGKFSSLLILNYFLVRSYACDSQPCKNGAACRNNEKDITKYHCDCTDDFSGVNCQGNRTSDSNNLQLIAEVFHDAF